MLPGIRAIPAPLQTSSDVDAGLNEARAAGARVVLPSNGTFSAQTFWRDVTNHGITQVIAVPTMLSMLLADARESFSGDDPCPLRHFFSVGAALPKTVHDGIREKFGLEVYEVSATFSRGHHVGPNWTRTWPLEAQLNLPVDTIGGLDVEAKETEDWAI